MNYKYKLLQDNPQICKRLFGIKFELLETIPLRLLDLCIKFFQDFVTWKVSQNERKPESVESTLPSAAELETHGPIQGSTGYYSLNSCGTPPDSNLGLRPMQE